MTAIARNQSAQVSPLDQQEAACTSFTGELIALTRAGIPDGPSELTLSTLYPYLRQRLIALGLPQPNQRGTDTADRHVFATNAHRMGARPPVGEAAAWTNRADTSYEQANTLKRKRRIERSSASIPTGPVHTTASASS